MKPFFFLPWTMEMWSTGMPVTTTLKPLDAVHHSALSFITEDTYSTHHCILFEKVGWPSLSQRRDMHFFLIIYKALTGKLPMFISSILIGYSSSYQTRKSRFLLQIPHVCSELGKTASHSCAPYFGISCKPVLILMYLFHLNKSSLKIIQDIHIAFCIYSAFILYRQPWA